MRHLKKHYISQEDTLAKLKSEWSSVEEDSAWDFDTFWNKINELSGISIDDQNPYIENSIYFRYSDIYSCHIEKQEYPVEFSNNINWQKRNGIICSLTNIGGVSGGSCWDDSDPQPYYTNNIINYIDFENYLKEIILLIFGHNHPFANIKEILSKLSEQGTTFKRIVKHNTYTNYEYYGNYDEYEYYYITLWDLYSFLSKNRFL